MLKNALQVDAWSTVVDMLVQNLQVDAMQKKEKEREMIRKWLFKYEYEQGLLPGVIRPHTIKSLHVLCNGG